MRAEASRVTVFLPSLAGGGAERAMVTLANGLAARGLVVTLALGCAEGPYLSLVDASVHVLDLRSSSVFFAVPALVRHLREFQPQALLAAMSHANVAAALAHAWAASPARLVLSERANLSAVYSAHQGLRVSITRVLMRLSYPRADAIVAVSQGVANDLAAHVRVRPERVVTLPNPVVDADLLAQAAEAPTHPWFAPGQPPVVLGAGRLIAQKDFSTLLSAFAELRATRPLRLMILGEGPLRVALQDQAERLGVAQDVALPGFVHPPFSLMRAAAAFVLSSRFEGLPGVLIQAMACGTRVLSTDCPSGPREVLEGGRWGALVPVADPGALAAALRATLDDPHPPDVRSRAAAFSVDASVAAYARVLGVA